MLIDARDLAEQTVLRTDVCIVGGGAAGITIARDLQGRGLDVVLLESGGLEADPDTQDLAAGAMIDAVFRDGFDPEREIRLQDTRLRYLGGTTNHWAGFCRPLRPVDYERRSGLVRSGWPFGPDELDPWYRRAHEVIRLGPYEYDWRFWQDRDGFPRPVLDGPDVSPVLFQIKFPFSFGEVHRADLEQAEDVRLVLHATATGLRLDPGGTRVERVDVTALDGPGFVVEPRVVVTAVGGIDSARLLLASDDVRPAGVGNGNDLVGRFFCDHLMVPSGFAVANRPLDGYAGLRYDGAGPDGSETVGVRSAAVLADETVRREGRLGLELQLVPFPPTPGATVQDEGVASDAATRLLEAVGGDEVASVAYLQASTEMSLDPDNRVTLQRGRLDATGVPRVSVAWRPRERDIDAIVSGLAIMAAAMGATGSMRAQLVPDRIRVARPADPDGPLFRTLPRDGPLDLSAGASVSFHHMCSTRMATSPREGVVDADLRVHDTANLFVAGSASFATPGTSVPTLTIVALALRLADLIVRELSS